MSIGRRWKLCHTLEEIKLCLCEMKRSFYSVKTEYIHMNSSIKTFICINEYVKKNAFVEICNDGWPCSSFNNIASHWWMENWHLVTIPLLLMYCKDRSMWHATKCNSPVLTHGGRDKMTAISQTTFWKALSLMKMYEFWLRFHWSLFQKVQMAIFHHWFR